MPILRKISIALLAATLAPLTASAQPKPGELDAVIRQMDTASTRFKSAEADFRWDFYELVVKETTTQSGTIYFLKNAGKTEMGAQVAPPQTKFLEYKNGLLRLFDPISDHLTILTAGKNQSQYESFLTLGFGGSGSDLAKAWTIADGGPETLSDGHKQIETRKLDLVSKDPNVRNMFTHITIWVDPERGISLRQKFFTPSGDYRTAIYTNIRYDQPVNAKPYAIKTDKKTTVDRR
ncbi:LolA family protein [Edaphobacter bradus]|uniref:LolA family protein n=1 Tax=Edaphobacter bradus TaxID=2259016 RepID=UPI0021DF5023|nr:outer membrane lipoprotein-sorting protein [Edaphobacter bradus]